MNGLQRRCRVPAREVEVAALIAQGMQSTKPTLSQRFGPIWPWNGIQRKMMGKGRLTIQVAVHKLLGGFALGAMNGRPQLEPETPAVDVPNALGKHHVLSYASTRN